MEVWSEGKVAKSHAIAASLVQALGVVRVDTDPMCVQEHSYSICMFLYMYTCIFPLHESEAGVYTQAFNAM